MSKAIEDLKSGNYEVVDNQGVSVTQHFTQCLEKEFADLEAKLADTEFRYENLHNLYYKDTEELKQQLAEKEEQINMLEEHKFYADNIIQAYADKCKKANQDKISFCIEKLEKVREIALKDFNLDKGNLPLARVLDNIDNQIKTIKEME